MVEEGFQERATAEKKLLRAKLDSTQLAQYFLGLDEIRALEARLPQAGGRRVHAARLRRGADRPRLDRGEAAAALRAGTVGVAARFWSPASGGWGFSFGERSWNGRRTGHRRSLRAWQPRRGRRGAALYVPERKPHPPRADSNSPIERNRLK